MYAPARKTQDKQFLPSNRALRTSRGYRGLRDLCRNFKRHIITLPYAYAGLLTIQAINPVEIPR